ncbi:hypothetical protein PYX07_09730 [Pseudomonas aeruginosa]|nr:hypothetical protein [Pseudomonas aeruginosa]
MSIESSRHRHNPPGFLAGYPASAVPEFEKQIKLLIYMDFTKKESLLSEASGATPGQGLPLAARALPAPGRHRLAVISAG